MDKVGAFEAKNTLGSLLDRVERDEEIVITRRRTAESEIARQRDDECGRGSRYSARPTPPKDFR